MSLRAASLGHPDCLNCFGSGCECVLYRRPAGGLAEGAERRTEIAG
jgi:hypothetical protein